MNSCVYLIKVLIDLQTPYLSACDFIFAILYLEICSLMNWIFLSAVASKIQVLNRIKIKFLKLDISNWKNRVQIDRGTIVALNEIMIERGLHIF